jgi:hypothetical protein
VSIRQFLRNKQKPLLDLGKVISCVGRIHQRQWPRICTLKTAKKWGANEEVGIEPPRETGLII